MSKTTQYTTPLVPASSAVLTLHATHRIRASAALVFRALRNTETWKDWNHFVPNVSIRSQPEDGQRGGEYGGERNPSTASIASSVNTLNKLENQKSKTHTVHIGGDPSTRLKRGTQVTFHCRMKPDEPTKFTDTELIVTEVSRPDDVRYDLARSETHTAPPQGQNMYRIVWALNETLVFPASYPKWMLLAQRVHEVRPIVRGDGKDECEITTWECMKGTVAHVIKKKHGTFLQERFEEWVRDLGAFCEALVGDVERRDFSVAGLEVNQ